MLFDYEDREAIRVCGFWYWAWCRTGLYRLTMKLAHRFNWHHTRTLGPFDDGYSIIVCDWCGLSHRTKPIGDYARVARELTV